MKHLTPLTRTSSRPVLADFSILGTRALVGLLSDIVGFLGGVSALIKGEPGDGGNGDGDGGANGDEHSDMDM